MSYGRSITRLGWWRRLVLGFLAVALFLAGGLSVLAAPASLVVVGSGTPDSCTEAAFNSALSSLQSSGGGTLIFNCGGAAAIQFTSHKNIYTSVVIDGGGLITLSGGNTTRHFVMTNAASLILRTVTLVDGNSGADYGGSIYNNGGVLTLQGSTIRSCGTTGYGGGAIASFIGTVDLQDSTIELSESSYGAIYSTGSVNLLRSMIRNNNASAGGGGLTVGGVVNIDESYFENNRAPQGGAIYSTQYGNVQITRSQFISNMADAPVSSESQGGAILNYGQMTIKRSYFAANLSTGFGGAILSGPTSQDAYLNIQQSTFTANLAVERGGAIDNRRGSFTLANSTVSGNEAGSGGGVVNFLGPAYLYYATIVGNIGGNLEQTALANYVDNTRQRITLSRTVLSGGANCAINGTPGPLAHFVSNLYNLSDDDSCAFFLNQAGDSNNTDPQLGSLADHGGQAYTHLPAEGSPLVNAAECSFDFTHDQRGISRPQGGQCDIGAVELTPSGVQPTPLPSPTPRPTPTPVPTPTVPVPGAVVQAPAPIRAGGPRPTIQLSANHGYGGQPVTISGLGVAGYDRVRIFSMEGGQTVGAIEANVNPQGSYQVTLNVPAAAAPGPGQVCALAVGLANAELECADFTIDPMPAGRLTGQVQSPNIGDWNAQVSVVDTRGRLVQVAPIDSAGNFLVDNLYPGKYKAAVTGQTSGNIDPFEVTIFPQRDTGINPLTNANPCLPGDGDSLILLNRMYGNPDSLASFDPYDNVFVSRVHPFSVDAIDLQLNATLFQREDYGYYVSGVPRDETFLVYPQLRSQLDGVIFRLYNADDTLVEQKPIQQFSPYEVTFNVGQLAPSSKSLGNPYVEAVLVVNGEPEPCPTRVPIRVIADPMKDSRLRQNGSQTWWDDTANMYRFKGVIPNVPGLPFEFLIPPPPVPPLPVFTRFDNRLDAGIYFQGFLTEDGLVVVDAADARAEVKVLNAVILSPTEYKLINLSDAQKSLQNWQDLQIRIPKLSLLPKSPLEVGVPFVATPALTLFGLIEITVGSSAKGAFDVTLEGSVAPFKPNATATLTPWGSAEAELTVGAGLGSGLVSTGAGPGFRLKVSTPLTADLFPRPKLTMQLCPEITVFLHVYAQAAWGLVAKHHYENLVTLNECFNLADEADLIELGEPPPDVFAAPAVATAPDGRVLTAFVENTGTVDSPQIQIIANLQGQAVNLRQAVSDATHSATNPVVAFTGPSALPLVAWVEKPYDPATAQLLGTDLNAHVTRQEIFYSIYQAGQWSSPQRLTHDLLGDGMPALAGNDNGAVLAWVRDLDGNFGTRSDQRIAASLFNLQTLTFGSFELLSPGLSGLNGDVRAAYLDSTPYLAWIYDADAHLPTADDRQVVIAQWNAGGWSLEMPANLPARVDSPAISVDNQGISLAFLVREANSDGQVGLLGANGVLWTARKQQGAWNAAPLRGSEGELIFGEQPSLASLQNETLLAFRRIGDPSTYAGLGQISLSRLKPDGQFSTPLYTTNDDHQNWQPALAINPLTQEAIVIKVSRAAWQPAPDAAGSVVRAKTAITRQEAYLSASALSAAEPMSLNASQDPVEMVTIRETADPALDWMQLSAPDAPPDTPVEITVQLRNAGRNPTGLIQIDLYSGLPGGGVLLENQTHAQPLSFNQTQLVTFTINRTPGLQPLYAQVTASAGNLSPLNDSVALTIGELSAPDMEAITTSAFTPEALEITWYPLQEEFAASYRVLRGSSPAGPFEVIGETRFARFTDTLVELGQFYCYRVQSYNGNGNISEPAAPICSQYAPWAIHLPLLKR